jgi:hypothetical protein
MIPNKFIDGNIHINERLTLKQGPPANDRCVVVIDLHWMPEGCPAQSVRTSLSHWEAVDLFEALKLVLQKTG